MEVGVIFTKVLEHCGVFKWDEDGQEAIKRYIKDLQQVCMDEEVDYEVC